MNARSLQQTFLRASLVGLSLLTLVFLSGCVTEEISGGVHRNVSSAHDKRIDLGFKYLSVGNRELARWQFNKALELDKESAEAVRGLALVHQANGEFEPAEEQFQRALRLSKGRDHSSASLSFGVFLMEQGRAQEACQHFEKAGGDYDFGSRPEALVWAARCAKATGNTARVRSAYDQAVKLNDRFGPALLDVAEMSFADKDYVSTKRYLDRYMVVVPTPSAKSLWLGFQLEKIFGNEGKAQQYISQLKKLHPYSNEYLEFKRQAGHREPR